MNHPTPIWDLPIRLFHWSLPLLIIGAWASAELGEMQYHQWIGYALIVLVSFRIIWGMVGSTHARFTDFVRGPMTVLHYLRQGHATEGHNPAGGWSVLVLLSLILVQTISGLFNSDDVMLFGPMNHLVDSKTAKFMHETHEIAFNLLLGMIALHLIAIGYYQWGRKHDLIRPMLYGGVSTDGKNRIRPSGWALLIIAACAIALWFGLEQVPAPRFLY